MSLVINMPQETPFTDPKTFSFYIENIVMLEKVSYLDAIVEYCKVNFVDPEDIGELLTDSLREKLRSSFIAMKYIKASASFDL